MKLIQNHTMHSQTISLFVYRVSQSHTIVKALCVGYAPFFDVLLTVHLSIFISVFNQLDAQFLFYSKFYFMPLHVSSICAHHQEAKIVSHSLWYHHTYRCFISFISCLYMFRAHVLIISKPKLYYTASGIITPIGVL